MNEREKRSLLLVGAGIASLFIAMGVGRFAYTPILPLMLKQQLFTEAGAGALASSNYAGYLAGAIMTALRARKESRLSRLKLALVVSVAMTAWMGVADNYALWLALRFVSGFASAVIFVYVSGLVMDGLAGLSKSHHAVGLFYSGVGLGITATGFAVPWLDVQYGWRGTWLGMALVCAVLLALAWTKLREPTDSAATGARTGSSVPEDRSSLTSFKIRLLIVYGLEGLGYIVTGTFLVAYVQQLPAMQSFSAWIWMLVGATAIPSCWLWSLLAGRLGSRSALFAALALQAAGIALPVVYPAWPGVLLGAVLFGLTFMGVTTLTISWTRQRMPADAGRFVGVLTAVYGAGQVIGPIVAGWMVSGTGNYQGALIGAASIVCAGALATIFPAGRKGAFAKTARTSGAKR
ncbi:Predicted arabinose efflux permease, MFS family [Paenibacillus tianmuensis]|uniref:Predicted arabinose efflux permease, MFS family n=1 Tax=Paenibacillus tianmuensis TaxID=624147 RepID=A0A1G4QTY0_9BACL|nr:YbfB/YjiJ family MFS transporter [Paenibacillus tianmuensis]SCW47905.1 Predicted arabinose efflux permease, MFS family [Paenibacillus tianmuensis]